MCVCGGFMCFVQLLLYFLSWHYYCYVSVIVQLNSCFVMLTFGDVI